MLREQTIIKIETSDAAVIQWVFDVSKRTARHQPETLFGHKFFLRGYDTISNSSGVKMFAELGELMIIEGVADLPPQQELFGQS